MDVRIEIEADRTREAVHGLSALLQPVFERTLSKQDAGRIEIAVTELCNNAVIHASAEQRELPFTLDVHISTTRVEVRLTDIDNGFDPTVCKRRTFDESQREQLPTGGMGLILIHDVMDEVHHETDGRTSVVRLVRAVRRDGCEATPIRVESDDAEPPDDGSPEEGGEV